MGGTALRGKMGEAGERRQGHTAHAGHRLTGLINALLDPAARRRGFAVASLLADWPTIVGPSLARRCQPIRVEHAPGRRGGGSLLLHVGSAAAIEIQHAAPQIIERINTYFGFNAVRQLRLLQVPMRPAPAPRAVRPPPHDPRLEAALAEKVEAVGDAELRAALLALGRAVHGTRS